jgi:MFS family permease
MSATTTVADVRRIARGPVRRLYVGQFVKSLGAGMTLALLVVYLTKVRDIPVITATSLLAWQAVLALLCSPLVGTLVDRFGPRHILMGGALLTALGTATFAWVQTPVQAFLAMSAIAVAGAAIWGPSSTLLARLVPHQDRSTAFGFEFMLLNLGLGLGALIGASIVDVTQPDTYTLLYSVNALAFVALFIAVWSMGDVGRLADADQGADEDTGKGAWREVLADRTLRRYALVGLLLLTAGYGSIDAGLAYYVHVSMGLSDSYIGVIFAANTMVIVVMQLVSITIIRGRRRSRVMGVVGLIWAASWILFGLANGPSGTWAALGLAMIAMSVFAFGETLWSPTAPALLNDLPPEHLRGRYNSVQSLLWGVAGSLGPLMSGAFFARDLGTGWTAALAAGCLLGALLALRMGRFLTPEQEGLTRGDSPEETPDGTRDDTPGEPSQSEHAPVG